MFNASYKEPEMSWEILIQHILNVVSILVVLADSLSETKE